MSLLLAASGGPPPPTIVDDAPGFVANALVCLIAAAAPINAVDELPTAAVSIVDDAPWSPDASPVRYTLVSIATDDELPRVVLDDPGVTTWPAVVAGWRTDPQTVEELPIAAAPSLVDDPAPLLASARPLWPVAAPAVFAADEVAPVVAASNVDDPDWRAWGGTRSLSPAEPPASADELAALALDDEPAHFHGPRFALPALVAALAVDELPAAALDEGSEWISALFVATRQAWAPAFTDEIATAALDDPGPHAPGWTIRGLPPGAFAFDVEQLATGSAPAGVAVEIGVPPPTAAVVPHGAVATVATDSARASVLSAAGAAAIAPAYPSAAVAPHFATASVEVSATTATAASSASSATVTSSFASASVDS